MSDLLDPENRRHLEDVMVKYFLVDQIRRDYGDLNETLDHADEINHLISIRESSVRIFVQQMSDKELLHELVHARTGSSVDNEKQ